jgi:tetratricopeptide (TPR) repeat protein
MIPGCCVTGVALLIALVTPGFAADSEPNGFISRGDGAPWNALGDRLFRQGDFDAAGRAYESAINNDPGFARAYAGLSRVEFARWNGPSARDLAAKAYRLAPYDTEVLAQYIQFVTDPAARAILLRNLAALSETGGVEQRSHLLTEAQRLREPGNAPVDASIDYDLDLEYFRPYGSLPSGLLITARVDGGKPLRLVLDTGARGILIDPGAATRLKLDVLAESAIGGIAGTSANGRIARAHRIAFGSLEIANPVIEISDHKLTGGADGVVGLQVFSAFQIRVDAVARKLQLWARANARVPEQQLAVYRLHHLLLVKARIEDGPEGLFLFDTGSAYTSVSSELVRSSLSLAPVPVMGPCGSTITATRIPATRFDIGGAMFTDRAPLALDLRHTSDREGVRISGVFGFPLFRNGGFTVDYERGILELQGLHRP